MGYLSDSTHSLSQSRYYLYTDDVDMMSRVYRYFLSVMVWHYCGHIPTLYCYTTYCAHWHNWIVYKLFLCSPTLTISFHSQICTELCHYTIQVQSDYSSESSIVLCHRTIEYPQQCVTIQWKLRCHFIVCRLLADHMQNIKLWDQTLWVLGHVQTVFSIQSMWWCNSLHLQWHWMLLL